MEGSYRSSQSDLLGLLPNAVDALSEHTSQKQNVGNLSCGCVFVGTVWDFRGDRREEAGVP